MQGLMNVESRNAVYKENCVSISRNFVTLCRDLIGLDLIPLQQYVDITSICLAL